MNTISSFFSKNWICCGLALVAVGAVLLAVQQGVSRRHRPDVQGVSPVPTQETRDLRDSSAAAEFPQVEIPVLVTPKKSSPVSARGNVVAPVSRTVSRQTAPPRLARAVKAERNAAAVGVDPPGNSETLPVDPPLAFIIVDPQNVTPKQQTALAMIQQQFLKAMEGGDQDLADPAYLDRWLNAQNAADQTYKAMFGWAAFNQMQLERARNSYTEIQLP